MVRTAAAACMVGAAMHASGVGDFKTKFFQKTKLLNEN
jgi:hypothetical protein